MIEKDATVTALDGELAVLTVAAQTACDGCSTRAACGTSVLSQLFGRRTRLLAYNKIHAKPGDVVTVAIPEHILLKVSMMMYIMPLVSMLLFSATAHYLFNSEAIAISGGVVGLIAGLFFFRWYGQYLQTNSDNLPVLVRQYRPINVTMPASK